MLWRDDAARLAGVRRALTQPPTGEQRPDAMLLVAHFPSRLMPLTELVQAETWPVPALAVSAAELTLSILDRLVLDESHSLRILVVERHPHPDHDKALLDLLRNLACRTRALHHLAYDDVLLRMVASETAALRRDRMVPNVNGQIESVLIGPRIKLAQKRVARHACSDFATDSAAEWLQRNCPELPWENQDESA